MSEGKGNYNKRVPGAGFQVLATLAALVPVPAFAKGVEEGFETGFGALLGIYQRVDFSVRLFFEPAKFGHADAHQLLKAAHPLVKALVAAVHAGIGAVHAGIEPIHAGIGGRLTFCHRFQDGFDLIEFLSNIGFHT
jgi:hypothetical protein